jgi:hypothetical protein
VSTKDMMAHPYFSHDNFGEKFEPILRQTIDMEREKEQADRQRRKRSKKVYISNIGSRKSAKCAIQKGKSR